MYWNEDHTYVMLMSPKNCVNCTYIKGGCPKLKKRERLLLYYYSYTIVYDFTARITIVILNILKYSIDDFISVLR